MTNTSTQAMIDVGIRVRVKLRDPSQYGNAAATCIDGKTGTVEEQQEHSTNGFVWLGPALLVRFDTPAKRWWGSEKLAGPTHFWFPPEDLEQIP